MSTEPQVEGTLSVTDSRTGQTYEFPISEGTIRATDLRAAVAAGRSIRYRTPRAVEAYIEAHGLYRAVEH